MAGRLGGTNEEKEALQEDIMQAILEDDDAYLDTIVNPPPGPRPKYNDEEAYTSGCMKTVSEGRPRRRVAFVGPHERVT